MKTAIFLVMFLVSGCGRDESSGVASAPAAAASTTSPSEAAGDCSPTKHYCAVTGSIDSAFQLTADGLLYPSIESFYSYEVDFLQGQADEGGYAGWSSNFTAQLGLNDLKHGLDVYAQDMSGEGFSGSSVVRMDGTFVVPVTTGDTTNEYALRVNKRITYTLTSPDGKESVKWCWNFSGEADQVGINKPIIVNTFSSTLTKYQCADTQSGTIITPRK